MKFLGGLALLCLTSLLRGMVLSVLWGWFIVTTLHAPELSIPEALGISTVVTVLTANVASSAEKYTWVEMYVVSALGSLYFLAAGWIIHLFVVIK